MESQLSILEPTSMMPASGESLNGAKIGGIGRMDRNQFGDLVRQAREQRGIRAYELADLMHTHGSQVSRLENGTFKETPAPDVLNQLHELLGLRHRDMLEALGYVIDEETPTAGENRDEDNLRDQLTALVRQVRWAEKPSLAHSLITVTAGILQDQENATAKRRQAASGSGLGR